MTKTVVDFNRNTETVILILKEDDKQFAAQLVIENKWKWRANEYGTKVLKHKWYKGIDEFLLNLLPRAYFTQAFIEQATIEGGEDEE